MRKDRTSLSQLEEDLGLGFVEPAVSRRFEEMKSNVFETAPPRWKLEDSQKGWGQEEKKRTMKWGADKTRAEVADSQTEEGSTTATVASKQDIQRKQGQERRPLVGSSGRVNQRKLSEDEDLEMEEADKVTRGLEGSKHVVKELMEKEIKEMIKQIGLKEEKIEDKDKEMGQEEEDGRSDLFNAPHDSRNASGLIRSILKTNEVVEEFRALPNNKKWWKPAKDANLAKD